MPKNVTISAQPDTQGIAISFRLEGSPPKLMAAVLVTTDAPGGPLAQREHAEFLMSTVNLPGGITQAQFRACLKAVHDQAIANLGY